ncbi:MULTISPECIES: alpha/beta fold hydrolase [Sphingomonas]|uniref:alpha/beta fold hydrolase n=1 Tax=Sphingomonas TaxID=13687 RepID=UPI001E416A98|nr:MULTISPECIES: alpha/beta hydrolase [Sphingomonas]
MELIEVLRLERPIVAGFDWGARSACGLAALYPERVRAIVSVSGYLISSQAIGRRPQAPAAEREWWYLHYFATERGRTGYATFTKDFARLIWQTASPRWTFDEPRFARPAAALSNPDHVDVTIHNYRWRQSLASGDPRYAHLEARLATLPAVRLPSITLEGMRMALPSAAGRLSDQVRRAV